MWAPTLRDYADSWGRRLAAIAAGVLPSRHWPALEAHVPVREAAVASSLVTLLAGAAVGIPAYLAHAGAVASRATTRMLEATGWLAPAAAVAPGEAEAAWLASYLSLVSFLFFTPAGLAATYLCATGLLRAASAWVDQAMGDPLLTGADWLLHTHRRRRRASRAAADRERLEGPEVPDRVVTGAQAGIEGADLVVVASRRKTGWNAGVFVIADEEWYRLGTPVDRETPSGLRTLYPLSEIRDHEALRKGVRYRLPAAAARRQR